VQKVLVEQADFFGAPSCGTTCFAPITLIVGPLSFRRNSEAAARSFRRRMQWRVRLTESMDRQGFRRRPRRSDLHTRPGAPQSIRAHVHIVVEEQNDVARPARTTRVARGRKSCRSRPHDAHRPDASMAGLRFPCHITYRISPLSVAEPRPSPHARRRGGLL